MNHERVAEEANIVAEYAGLSIEFGSKPHEREGCCLITWGPVGAPHDRHSLDGQSQAVVNMVHAVGRLKNCPDRAKTFDIFQALAAADPDVLDAQAS